MPREVHREVPAATHSSGLALECVCCCRKWLRSIPPGAALQANLWTEFISDEITAEYMLLPRLCALAECVWSPTQIRNWRWFLDRTQVLLGKLSLAGYNFRPLYYAQEPAAEQER